LAVAAVAAVAISYAVLFAKINARDAEIARLELRLAECGQKVKDADIAIEKQNAAIEAVRVDTVVVVEKIKDVARRYTATRDVVVERITKDSTSENKIAVIDDLLRGFCNNGLRAKDSN
jgi:hypothetical protein